MQRNKRSTVIRYSKAFKLQVVSEIEKGKYSIWEAKRIYGIKGAATIQNWLKKFSKLDVLPKRIKVEHPNETEELKRLRKEIKKLKSALADSALDKSIAESALEEVCDQLGLDVEEVKKKAGI